MNKRENSNQPCPLFLATFCVFERDKRGSQESSESVVNLKKLLFKGLIG